MRRRALLSAPALLLLAACSAAPSTPAPSSSAPASSSPASAAPSSSAPATAAKGAICQTVSADTRSAILSGVRPDAGSVKADKWASIKRDGGFYVAARVTAPGVDQTAVVFRMPDLASGPVLSANSDATALFEWPKPGAYPKGAIEDVVDCL